MLDELPTTSLVMRLAVSEDIDQIDHLDSFSISPTRDIHRDMEKYFGSIDPSTHERTLIFLAEVNGATAAKAELMLPAHDTPSPVGYIKRVVVHPSYRKQGLARQLMQYMLNFVRTQCELQAVDLHVWEDNVPAIRLYEELGFVLRHRELYYRLSL